MVQLFIHTLANNYCDKIINVSKLGYWDDCQNYNDLLIYTVPLAPLRMSVALGKEMGTASGMYEETSHKLSRAYVYTPTEKRVQTNTKNINRAPL